MQKKEYERLKKVALERIKNNSIDLVQSFKNKDIQELSQISEIYQAELEAQNDELQNHIINLEEAQHELQILFTQSPIPYILMSKKFEVLRANEEAIKLFGVDKIYSKSIPFYTYLTKNSITTFIDWINKKEKLNTAIEMLLRTTKGLRYCKLHFYKWSNHNNDTFLLSIEDIHIQKEESDKFKSLFNNSQQGIIFLDKSYEIKNVNDKGLDILSLKKEYVINEKFDNLDISFYDENKNIILFEELPFVLVSSTKQIISNRVISLKNRGTDEFIWLNVEAIPYFNIEDKKLIGIFCIFSDISNEYLLNQELNQQLDNFKTLGDNIPDKIFRIDRKQNILFFNKNALEFLDKKDITGIKNKLWDLNLFKSQRGKELKSLLSDLSKLKKSITFSLNDIKTKKNYFIRVIPEDTKSLSKTFLVIIEDITQRIETESMFNQLFYNSSDAIVLAEHKTGLIKSINAKAKKLLEISEKSISSLNSRYIFDRFKSEKKFKEHIDTLDCCSEDSYETKKLLDNGETIYLKVYCSLITIGKHTYHQSIIHDLTEHKLLERQLNQTSKVFEHTVEGILITDLNGKIISVNDAFTKITGYTREDILSKRPSILKSGKQNKDFYEKMWDDISKNGLWKGEIWNKKKDGTVYPEWLAISTIYDENNKPLQYVAIFSDFSEIKKHQMQLQELAHYDTLTSLPNRLLLHQELSFMIKAAKRQKTKLAVLFMDLDRFKNINDTFGHGIGDSVLKETSKRLKQLVRASDIVARIGGDEFVIVLYDIKSIKDIEQISESILRELRKPFKIDNKEHFISGSIGSSVYPDDSISIDSLLQYSDIAMYESKNLGKNSFSLFSMDMLHKANSISTLHNDLSKALENNEFYLEYQPQYEMISNITYGFEALIRWNHSTLGKLSPDKFIKYAEESMLIIPIGKWILEQVIKDWKIIKEAYPNTISISVNVSHKQLNQDFVNQLENLTKIHQGFSKMIKIEITETSAMKNALLTKNTLRQIKDLGFSISLDDFGTGYSSLSAIKTLSVDEIKIDRSFIKDVPGDEDDEELVTTIIAMAKVMKKHVIAEGVESEETRKFLLERECNNI